MSNKNLFENLEEKEVKELLILTLKTLLVIDYKFEKKLYGEINFDKVKDEYEKTKTELSVLVNEF